MTNSLDVSNDLDQALNITYVPAMAPAWVVKGATVVSDGLTKYVHPYTHYRNVAVMSLVGYFGYGGAVNVRDGVSAMRAAREAARAAKTDMPRLPDQPTNPSQHIARPRSGTVQKGDSSVLGSCHALPPAQASGAPQAVPSQSNLVVSSTQKLSFGARVGDGIQQSIVWSARTAVALPKRVVTLLYRHSSGLVLVPCASLTLHPESIDLATQCIMHTHRSQECLDASERSFAKSTFVLATASTLYTISTAVAYACTLAVGPGFAGVVLLTTGAGSVVGAYHFITPEREREIESRAITAYKSLKEKVGDTAALAVTAAPVLTGCAYVAWTVITTVPVIVKSGVSLVAAITSPVAFLALGATAGIVGGIAYFYRPVGDHIRDKAGQFADWFAETFGDGSVFWSVVVGASVAALGVARTLCVGTKKAVVASVDAIKKRLPSAKDAVRQLALGSAIDDVGGFGGGGGGGCAAMPSMGVVLQGAQAPQPIALTQAVGAISQIASQLNAIATNLGHAVTQGQLVADTTDTVQGITTSVHGLIDNQDVGHVVAVIQAVSNAVETVQPPAITAPQLVQALIVAVVQATQQVHTALHSLGVAVSLVDIAQQASDAAVNAGAAFATTIAQGDVLVVHGQDPETATPPMIPLLTTTFTPSEADSENAGAPNPNAAQPTQHDGSIPLDAVGMLLQHASPHSPTAAHHHIPGSPPASPHRGSSGPRSDATLPQLATAVHDHGHEVLLTGAEGNSTDRLYH